MRWYHTTEELSEKNREVGLRFMTYDGLCSHAMMMLVTGAFLPGMAVALGADNFVIGLLGSLAPMSQMVQIPAIWIVEKIGLRKLVTVVFAEQCEIHCQKLLNKVAAKVIEVPIFKACFYQR